MEDSYAAGLIDGEGTVTLSKKGNENRSPVVSVSSTSYELLEFLRQRYGGVISDHKTYRDHHKQSWSWRVTHDAALDMLVKILPHMREVKKARRARFILDGYKKVTKRNGKYTAEEIRNKQIFEAVFFSL